jgi:hypothetical protein
MAQSFSFDKTDLRKKLKQFGLSDTHLEEIFGLFDRKSRHMDVITFVTNLEKFGVSRLQVVNFLKDVGIDDITLTSILSRADYKKAGIDDKKMQEVVLKE